MVAKSYSFLIPSAIRMDADVLEIFNWIHSQDPDMPKSVILRKALRLGFKELQKIKLEAIRKGVTL